MDDATMAANEMREELREIKATLTIVVKRLDDMHADFAGLKGEVGGLKGEVGGLKGEVGGLKGEMRAGFKQINDQLNQAKVRDEELHRLMKFGLEAREALRETMEARFGAAEQKQDEQIGLLKDVIRDLRDNTGSQ